MLYKVKNKNKYGEWKRMSKIGEIIYDDIGYKANSQNKILYTLIVPKMDNLANDSIVIKNNEKYGLMDIDNRRWVITLWSFRWVIFSKWARKNIL